jgi:outer membrane protein OmpA-like peptidoglycan-associated protein
MKKIIIFSLIFFLIHSLNSKEKPLFYLGGFASFNYNIHYADFDKLGDIPNCCPVFISGKGYGFSLGGLFEYPLRDEILIGARLGISKLDALLSKKEDIGNIRVLRNGTEVTDYVTTDHTLDSRLFTIGLEPYINYKFFGVINSYLGFKLSYLMSGMVDQKEEIISPDNVTFLDGRVIQNDFYDLDIPNMNSLLFFGVFGLGYDLKASKNIILTPEIRYNLPLNNICDVDWKASSWQFGAALKIPIYPPRILHEIFDTLYVRDTTVIADKRIQKESIKLIDRDYDTDDFEENDVLIYRTTITEKYEKKIPEASLLEASITAVGILNDGTRIEKPSIVIEETEVEEGFPLLPYVFFENGSSDLEKTGLKSLKKEEVEDFHEDSLEWETMEIYENLLNIIAFRLKKNPGERITIVGCNNNTGNEQNNLQLSKDRALAVEKYLTEVWGINEKTIHVKSRNLPENPGNKEDPDVIEENQRAELIVTNDELIEPVFLKDVEKTADPPVIALYPEVNSESELKNWNINVKQKENQLRKFSGTDLPNEIIWQLDDEPIPELELPANINFDVTDELGQNDTASEQLQLQQLTIRKKRYELKDDKRIERFFLIVFDFNSSELKGHHKPILDDIKSRIMPDSKVIISGYTDRTGNPEYNLDLAKRRCLEVQKYLKVKEENLVINPVGNQTLLYDNDIPQGRSYCRTVQIIIETPVQ